MSLLPPLSSHSIEASEIPPADAGPSEDPLLELAQRSPSLIPSRRKVTVSGEERQIPSFLLLGERGGGKPIRIGLFAGLGPGQEETIKALAGVLSEIARRPSLARDFALLAYPDVDSSGSGLEGRFEAGTNDPDVQFFQAEFRRWEFDGLITIRSSPLLKQPYGQVQGYLLATEILEPALNASLKVFSDAVVSIRLRPDGLGGLRPPARQRPNPFEIELYFPPLADSQVFKNGLFIVITEILRRYRVFIAHAENL